MHIREGRCPLNILSSIALIRWRMPKHGTLCRMLQTFSCIHIKSPHYRLCSILANISTNSGTIHFSTESFHLNPQTLSCSESNCTFEDSSSINVVAVSKSVISKCSQLLQTDKGKHFTSFYLKDYLLRISSVSPESVRRFWRASALKPQDVFEILLGFEYEKEKREVELKKVESLWGLFKWATEQSLGFEHIPRSRKIMGSILVRSGFLEETEELLSWRDSQGVLLDCGEIFSKLIEGYVMEFEFDKAISVFERMRSMQLVPFVSSYQALIGYLVELNETQLAYNIYLDLIQIGRGGSIEEKRKVIHDNVIRLLCMDGKVQEARDLVKKGLNYGIKPSYLVINSISCGYCDKRDYDDLLSFFGEVRIAPNGEAGNKILFSVCQNFGVDYASMFLPKLEELDFCPDEISLGILIGFSCRERKLKSAFFYVSDILSRGLIPHVYSYSAILSGMFEEGMWMHARDILAEMKDVGVTPDLSTFRVMLAGYCKARQFDEMKATVRDMLDHGLIELSSLEDPLTKGFMILGFNPSSVKIRRDNDPGFSRAEFFDNIGNGLYLDTDLDEFEKKITQVLEDAMIPEFNSSVICSRDVSVTAKIVEEMTRWGQEMSLSALSSIVSRHYSDDIFSIRTADCYLGAISKSTHQLHQSTLNILVQAYSKEGLTSKARALVDGMVRRCCTLDNSTYTALFLDICKKGDLRGFGRYWELAERSNWLPEAKEVNSLLVYMCQNKWLKEALDLFGKMQFVRACDFVGTFQFLLKELCHQGFTNIAFILMQELPHQAVILCHDAYNFLLGEFCRQKSLNEAFEVLDTLHSKRLSPSVDIVDQLVFQLCRTNNFGKAVDLKNVYSRVQPLALLQLNYALIEGFCKFGKVEEAAILLEEILVNGVCPDHCILNALIEAYSRENNLKKVKEILGFMISQNSTIFVSSYSKLARLLSAQGKISPCLNLTELMLQATHLPKLVLYNILIFHVSSMKNRSLLDGVIDAFLTKGLRFDDTCYNYLIRGYSLCADVSQAFHYLTTMIRLDRRPNNRSLRQVVRGLYHNGELQLALNLSQEMQSRGWHHGSVIQTIIVDWLLTKSMFREAVEFLDHMVVKGLVPNNIKYDYLIKQLCLHGILDKAVDLLNIMLRNESSPESMSYDYIIQGFCGDCKLDMALDFHAEMLYGNLKPSVATWDALIRSMIERGRTAEAESLVKSMIHLGETPSREAFCSVITKYRSENNTSKTSEVLKLMQLKGYVPDFDAHWSVISQLSDSSKKDNRHYKKSFLSNLLSGFGMGKKS